MRIAKGIIPKLEVWMKATTDIIIFSIANCILTPKISVGLVRPTNKGSDDKSATNYLNKDKYSFETVIIVVEK